MKLMQVGKTADTIKLNFRFWARAGKLRLASMSRHRQHDRLRPKSAMMETHAPQQLPALFDHLVGAQQERFLYREASALAALRLMTSSNLVGVSTGSSLGARTPENSVDQKQRTGNEASYL